MNEIKFYDGFFKQSEFNNVCGRPREDVIKWLLRPRNVEINNCLFILRKWSSTVPRIPRSHTITDRESFGGGYFILWRGYGLVVDPGFNFIDNFDKYTLLPEKNSISYKNLSISNIDGIALTHAHTDHTHDFEALLSIIWEKNRQGNLRKISKYQNQQINIILNRSTKHKYGDMLGTMHEQSLIKNIELIIAKNEKPVELLNNNDEHVISLHPVKAIHDDDFGEDTVGLIIELIEPDNRTNIKIGITSDTAWYEDIGNNYSDVNLLIPHIGMIEGEDYYQIRNHKEFNKSDFNKYLHDRFKPNHNSQHLGLCGALDLIVNANPQNIVILSEFYEQAGECDFRVGSARNIQLIANYLFNLHIRCIAGELGIKIKLPELKIFCDSVREFLEACDYKQTIHHDTATIRCCCKCHSF